jgi:hypothetical protein
MSVAFANLDVGLPGGSRNPDSARAAVRVEEAPLVVARQEYAFVGFAGKLSHNLGARGRRVTWNLQLRAISLTVLQAIERDMDAALQSGGGSLTVTTGRVYQRAILRSARPQAGWDRLRGGELDGWVRRDYVLEFEVISAD